MLINITLLGKEKDTIRLCVSNKRFLCDHEIHWPSKYFDGFRYNKKLEGVSKPVKQGNALSRWWFSSILTHMSRWETISLLWPNFCISGTLAFSKNRFSDVLPLKKFKTTATHLSCSTGSYYKTRQPTEWSFIDSSALHVSSFQRKAVIYPRGSESCPSRKEHKTPKLAWDFLRNRNSLDTLEKVLEANDLTHIGV